MWSISIDEHYFLSSNYKSGWARIAPPDKPKGPTPGVPNQNMADNPPDIPNTRLGVREEHFRGGTGETIAWPGILPMWFHYKNPVSGRVPPLYWPNCETCEASPQPAWTGTVTCCRSADYQNGLAAPSRISASRRSMPPEMPDGGGASGATHKISRISRLGLKLMLAP